MKTRILSIIALSLAMTFVAGCELMTDENKLSTDTPIHLSVSAVVGDLYDGATRFVFNPEDSTKLQWEGTETLGIMIGDNNSKTGSPSTYSTQPLATVSGKKGVFEGEVTLGTWTTDNIKGIVCPCTEHAWIRYNSDLRIVCRVGSEKQVQLHNNVLNSQYAPVFAEVSLTDFNVSGNSYSIEDKQLQWACSMFRYNIYGQHPQMNANEIFKSITLTCVSSWHLAGTYEWKIGQGKAVFGSERIVDIYKIVQSGDRFRIVCLLIVGAVEPYIQHYGLPVFFDILIGYHYVL